MPSELNLVIKNDDKPRANEPYVLEVDGERFHGPYLALNKSPVQETKTPDRTMPVHGAIRHHRDWLIQFLQEKKIPLVLSGHSHRNTLFSVFRERGEADQPAPQWSGKPP